MTTETNNKFMLWIKSRTKMDWVILSVGIIASIIIFFSLFNNPRETTYCHYEQNVTNTTLERYECANIKVISNTPNVVNVEAFQNLNLTNQVCSKKYNDLPKCNVPNVLDGSMFFAKYPMTTFNKNIDGILCSEMYVIFYTMDVEMYNEYKKRFSSEEATESFLKEQFNNCKIERGD